MICYSCKSPEVATKLKRDSHMFTHITYYLCVSCWQTKTCCAKCERFYEESLESCPTCDEEDLKIEEEEKMKEEDKKKDEEMKKEYLGKMLDLVEEKKENMQEQEYIQFCKLLQTIKKDTEEVQD